ncbi:MAG: hypothetical protein HC834_06725 [Rhodospirillales bacterium]|nr:hypothetical protein [Rhodospirillales bacterium]
MGGGLFALATAAPLLLVDGLFLLTVLLYLMAPLLPQNRLVLVQALAKAGYGLAMVVGGVLVALAGLATLLALLTLLFAFPFGTLYYFIEYNCASAALAAPPRSPMP